MSATVEIKRCSAPLAEQVEPGVRILRGRSQVLPALAAAGELFGRTGTPVCARADWLTAWYAAAPAAEAVAVVVGSPAAPAALACLAVTRRGPLVRLTLAGDGPSDYGRLPARDPAAAARLASGLVSVVRSLPRPWRLRLAQLPPADPVAAELAAALPAARVVPGQGCPQLQFGPDRTLDRHVSANRRRSVGRTHRGLARAGHEVRLHRSADPVQVASSLPDVFALQVARDHAVGRRSDLDRPEVRTFYLGVLAELSGRGEIELLTLRLDGRLAGFLLAIRDRMPDGTVLRVWSGRITSEYPTFGLGNLLRVRLVEAGLADPAVTGIDWLRGELQHKMHDITHVAPAEHVLADSSPWLAAGADRLVELRRAARRRVPDGLLRWLRDRG